MGRRFVARRRIVMLRILETSRGPGFRNSHAPSRSGEEHTERRAHTYTRGVSGHVVVKSNSPAVLSAGDTKQRLPEWMGRPGRPSSKLRYLSARWKRSALSLGSRREFRISESRSRPPALASGRVLPRARARAERRGGEIPRSKSLERSEISADFHLRFQPRRPRHNN